MTSLSRSLLSLRRMGVAGAAAGNELQDLFRLGPRRWWLERQGTAADPLAGKLRDAWYERLWAEAAAEVGATVAGGPSGLLTILRGGRTVRVWRQFLPLDNPVTLALAGDKPAVHRLLSDAGLRVPQYVATDVGDREQYASFLRAHRRMVVKPARSTGGGGGVTAGISAPSELWPALVRSVRYDRGRVLLEEHARGQEYRLLVLRGEPIAAVVRSMPTVVGNGRSSIFELIEEENQRRVRAEGAAGLARLTLDLNLHIALRGQGSSLSARPHDGEVVILKPTVSEGSERDAVAVPVESSDIAGIRDDAARAAKELGAEYVSVEFRTDDPSRSTTETGVVLEVNTTPGIWQHYAVRNPEPIGAATTILDRLLA